MSDHDTTTPAGWYDDPDSEGIQRYWDGAEWTERRQPKVPTAAPAVAQTAAPASGNGMAVAALVLGIVGMLIALIPIFGLFGLIMGVLAFIFGIAGWRKVKRGVTTTGKGMAITGAITGLIAVILGIVGLVIVNDAFTQLDEDLQELEDSFDDL